MKRVKFPTTKHDFSKINKAPIVGNLLLNNLENFGFQKDRFLNYYRPIFDQLSWENCPAARFFLRKRNQKLYITRFVDGSSNENEEDLNNQFPPLENGLIEAKPVLVENHFLGTLLSRIFSWLVKDPTTEMVKIGVYFNRISPQSSPINFKFSSLIINRNNISNGKSTIKNNLGQIILEYELKEGEFIFYAKNNDLNADENEFEHHLDFLKNKTSVNSAFIDLIQFEIDYYKI